MCTLPVLKKIANAIGDGKPGKHKKYGVDYYTLERDGKDITVVSAVGHLYTVAEKNKDGWKYPVFDIEWVPSADASKDAKYTRKYLKCIKSLAKQADEVTIASLFGGHGRLLARRGSARECDRSPGNDSAGSAQSDSISRMKPAIAATVSSRWESRKKWPPASSSTS